MLNQITINKCIYF